MKVKYISWGTGMKIGNTIYLNQKLKKLPRLHNAIMEHELKHSSSWSGKDMLLDLTDFESLSFKKDYWKFMFTNPRAWFSLSPIVRMNKRWSIDITLMIFYLIMGGVIGCLYFVI